MSRRTEEQKQEISEFIVDARQKLGMDKLGFADELNVTRRTIDYWESGDRAPNDPTLRWIGELLQREGHKVQPPV